ncbi:hypothetical protein, partial [Frankia nepalensis]|uniref:hypothetical protein n=1 Tax=Frankia nepalensis TaxID=1836974 RepID=UPI001D3AC5C5|nr:hypothetical protein [Frankia nepalensis]
MSSTPDAARPGDVGPRRRNPTPGQGTPTRAGPATGPRDPAGGGRDGPARPPGGTRWRRGDKGEDSDGALRGLVGGGRSKLSLTAAMRARDVAQPDAADLAEAEGIIAGRINADRARAARPTP